MKLSGPDMKESKNEGYPGLCVKAKDQQKEKC